MKPFVILLSYILLILLSVSVASGNDNPKVDPHLAEAIEDSEYKSNSVYPTAFDTQYRDIFLDAMGEAFVAVRLGEVSLQDPVLREKLKVFLMGVVSDVVTQAREKIPQGKSLQEFTYVAHEAFTQEMKKRSPEVFSYQQELESAEKLLKFQSCYGGGVVN